MVPEGINAQNLGRCVADIENDEKKMCPLKIYDTVIKNSAPLRKSRSKIARNGIPLFSTPLFDPTVTVDL